ncbi:glutathione S-transferase N-terminal domain-containing protein [Shewanella sp.]|uniref:glutathione S-transferase N-terminal domain-containing protein n=1 Tax=Shewanella sp. TaxID=50422 RepID=UPI003A984398
MSELAQPLPLLYNFRRCPYAMRARLAIIASGIAVNVRDIVLKHKPEAMLAISPKGTVPVLLLPNGTVIDESADIALWALTQRDPHRLLALSDIEHQWMMAQLERNDSEFKHWLDRYKYFDRFPEQSQASYFAAAITSLQPLEQQLASHAGHFLFERLTLVDLLLLPFVRQFAWVDSAAFANAPLPRVQQWLAHGLAQPWFTYAMQKRPLWLATGTEYQLLLPMD